MLFFGLQQSNRKCCSQTVIVFRSRFTAWLTAWGPAYSLYAGRCVKTCVGLYKRGYCCAISCRYWSLIKQAWHLRDKRLTPCHAIWRATEGRTQWQCAWGCVLGEAVSASPWREFRNVHVMTRTGTPCHSVSLDAAARQWLVACSSSVMRTYQL